MNLYIENVITYRIRYVYKLQVQYTSCKESFIQILESSNEFMSLIVIFIIDIFIEGVA